MKKSFFYSLAALLTTAAAACGLTACTSSDNVVENVEQPAEARVYRVSIPASMGGDAETRAVTFDGTNAAVSTFAAGDKVYIYNETKGAMACDGEGNAIALTLTNGDLSNGGKNCTLSGTLTFHKYESKTWNAVAVDGTDTYKLLYNLSEPNPREPIYSTFWYYKQDGTAEGIADYAVATTTLTDVGGVLTPTSTVSFTNVQSMFRFQFIDESSNAINVKHLVINSKKSAIAKNYYPIEVDPLLIYYCYSIPVTLTTPTTEYIYVALCINESEAAGDELMFRAVAADGKVYTGSKAAPGSGFMNGKYYYNTTAITLAHDASKDFTMPTIAWTNPSTPVELDYDGQYNLSTADFDITLSGTSRNCNVFNTSSGTVRLNGIDATDYGQFIYCGANLTVELLNGSANTIVSTNGVNCIGANMLKLSGNGTLTVTAKSADYCGIRGTTNYGSSNNDNATTTEIDVSAQLAADGYSVTRSARSDNGDGTYTWTYTVFPKTAYYAAMPDDVGKVIGSNGKIYATQAAAEAVSGVTAEAMIAFVGKIDGECEHGMAISLTDVYGYNATFAQATGDIIIPDWQAAHPITGGTWRLPSEADWQRMIWGYYTATPEGAAAVTATKAALTGGYYWTSTAVDADNAKLIYYDGSTYASVQSSAKTGEWHVRACLAF